MHHRPAGDDEAATVAADWSRAFRPRRPLVVSVFVVVFFFGTAFLIPCDSIVLARSALFLGPYWSFVQGFFVAPFENGGSSHTWFFLLLSFHFFFGGGPTTAALLLLLLLRLLLLLIFSFSHHTSLLFIDSSPGGSSRKRFFWVVFFVPETKKKREFTGCFKVYPPSHDRHT